MFSIIGIYYYLRVVKVMYFDAPQEGAPPLQPVPDVSLRVVLSANALALLALGLVFGAVARLVPARVRLTLRVMTAVMPAQAGMTSIEALASST